MRLAAFEKNPIKIKVRKSEAIESESLAKIDSTY